MERQKIQLLWETQPKQATAVIKRDYPDIYLEILSLPGSTFSEKSWKWVHGNSAIPTCECCDGSVKYLDFRRGYAAYCSKKCTANGKATREKREKTNLSKYGVAHYSKTNQYKDQFKSTCEARYGVTNPGAIPELKAKRARAKQLTYWNHIVESIREYTTPNFSFDEYTHVRDKELSWTCKVCGDAFISNIFGKLPKCPTCFPSGNTGGPSSVEKDVLNEITNMYSGTVLTNVRNLITPKEIDIYIPEFQLAIEINGVYWHSSDHVDSFYHQNKFLECQKKNLSLLMITDYEWQTKRSTVIAMIRHRLKQVPNIPARSCSVQPITPNQAKLFLDENHIHGYSTASGHLGLFYQNTLISVFSYMRNSRFDRKSKQLEIVRLAFAGRSTGALGKFIKYVKRMFPNESIVSYADLRYGSGNVYLNNGFRESHTTKPGYWYFYKNHMYHRMSWQKYKLVKLGADPALSEQEIMNSWGALRIYDCGHKCFVYEPRRAYYPEKD
jgi:hypothetical protein